MKKTIVKISIIFSFLLVTGLIFYFYFPQIWGEAVYPLKYDEYILKYSKRFNIRATLIAAVIFQESRYNSDSVSRAGAIGLMQIMPGTGRSIAGKLGEHFQINMLYDPETNIRYGSWYLKNLSDKYGGNTDYLLAAYNGGPAVADRWLAARGAPAGETKGFVASVKKAESMYVTLYPVLQEGQDVNLRVVVPPQPTLWEKVKKGLLFYK
ncbi:MAG: lytic transglycosylase [Candidatus Nealsonbacteria bacterium CG23_combo_of_CG06-09_8_20_14_all_40_13]|uniref:Lytic transglycosylase n=1 Tax=Candidatus Nealsonbacteria bacterium CG23_combo_of_CG06-09_8_20_14_all_40_13 TaxID=1974724 RepID=A0A2G9YQJ9_9BACT|nr:MAG: lytic transglycosylase [Candidatus Nealsonbacteria bacterium CG23_combo_of_CG06-09_8_20_14_all_40_13]PIR70907.1 MAG: lytic transglycosylase [Candidatus Nealsonbacteria bacterium CG10_big_fil_rev_8_21_14_0_10_40_24]PIU43347.1 MAG: lytic transglycosylase [Candidatus Nealsonbacteria bacterium CG07_land_8_20_14_0_80_40_10]